MGGGGSKSAPPPAPQKIIVTDPQPSGSTAVQMVGSDRPVNLPVNGVSIATAQGCDRCALYVVPNISTSAVKLSREFGDITDAECKQYTTDLGRVTSKMLSFGEFRSKLQSGSYYYSLGNGHCQQIEADAKALEGVEDINALTAKSAAIMKLTGRIRKVSTVGFSQNTKVQITPSIPLKMSVSIKGLAPKEIVVSRMTLYHPSPMRIENVQHDAVLSLNDPGSTGEGGVIVLVPLVAGSADTPSASFMSRILGNMTSLLGPDSASGAYRVVDAPTGAKWSLSELFPTDPETNAVKSGIFVWEGTPDLEQYVSEDTPFIRRTSWRRKNARAPMYIMLEKPLTMSNTDYASLVQFPVTAPEQAIHEMIAGSLTYKCGPEGDTVPTGDVKETFQTCDPFRPNYDIKTGYSPETMFRTLFNVLIFVAMGIGVWVALILVGDLRADQFFQSLSMASGKVLFRLVKGAQSAASSASSLTGLLKSPALSKFATKV